MTDYRTEAPWVIATTRVPYGHTDQMGHVYYANALLYFEMARNEWMRAGGLTYKDFEGLGFIVPVVEAHVNYRGRVLYDDVIEIAAAAREVGRTRFRFDYRIRRRGEDEVLYEGHTVHAVVNEKGRPMRVPERLTEMLDALGRGPEA